MQKVQDRVQDEVETIHLYVVREQEKKPYTILPLLCASLCLLGIATLTLYSAQHPYYEHERLIVPAVVLPLKTFTAQVAIIPTGVKSYPATTAHGVLTITNGSIIAQVLPIGFTVQGVATDRAVYIPAGSATGYGSATVAAHALVSGRGGNIPANALNQVEGSSVYIRNLSAFTGGRDSYSIYFTTPKDKELALTKSRNLLTSSVTGLHYPCSEKVSGALTVTWRCWFVTYSVPSYMHVNSAKLSGKSLLVDVSFLPRPVQLWVK